MRGSLILLALLILIPRLGWGQGSPVGPEFRVNTYTTNRQARPFVAADSAGHFVVTWMSLGQAGPDFDVFGQRYASSRLVLRRLRPTLQHDRPRRADALPRGVADQRRGDEPSAEA